MSKSSGNDIFKIISNAVDVGKKIANDMKTNSELAKIKSRQDDHKYNIGKIILEKKIKISDSLISSNIKVINSILSE